MKITSMVTRNDFIKHGFTEACEPLNLKKVEYYLSKKEFPKELLDGDMLGNIQNINNRMVYKKDGREYYVMLYRNRDGKTYPLQMASIAPGKRYVYTKGDIKFIFECVEGCKAVCNLRVTNCNSWSDFHVDSTLDISFDNVILAYIDEVKHRKSTELKDLNAKIRRLERSKKSCLEEANSKIKQLKELLDEKE